MKTERRFYISLPELAKHCDVHPVSQVTKTVFQLFCMNRKSYYIFVSSRPALIYLHFVPIYTMLRNLNVHSGWLVGCFGLNGPLRQYFSLYRAVSQREGDRGERIDESKNVQTTPHPHLLQAQ